VNKHITLVIGGCRSGKSSFALKKADRIGSDHAAANTGLRRNKYFIATSVPTDTEMQQRVVTHQRERGDDWQTIEEPVKIDQAIRERAANASVIVVDCLTLWVSNLLYILKTPVLIDQAISNLEQELEQCDCPVILVSNEVGYGIVPENKLARQFRDLAGSVNRKIAAVAHTVVLTVAGIDVLIKPKP
jgi:adenosylcobinamide kinase / adenosylcobinamide-phosphate guanylyltransferase